MFTITGLFAQRPVVNHNISSTSLTIASSSFGNDYNITQNPGTTNNRIVVNSGYQGTITLSGVNMTSPNFSPIDIQGRNNQSNLDPVTKVGIILNGQNTIRCSSDTYCAIQVNQGAQVHFSAIDPNDHNSGKLNVSTSASGGGATIGSPHSANQGSATIQCSTGSAGTVTRTAGGNMIFSSGIIDATGSQHGAGIGSGWYTYYNGIIIIYGGHVTARGGIHSAGIGSGCPTGHGVIACYAPNSSIIALPPATITATTAQTVTPQALGGTANVTYLNDPNKPLIRVCTEDFEQDATIYLDLKENANIVNIFAMLGIDYDLSNVRLGRTDASGFLNLRGEFQQNTTFYTDASSTNPAHLDRPYMPVVTTVSGSSSTVVDIVLPLLLTNISFTDYPSTPLEFGYTPMQAEANAYRIEISYDDADPMLNVRFSLQDGLHFSPLKFYAADGITPISAPTSLTKGMVIFISCPINNGEDIGNYSDVLLINGNYQGVALPGYIRRVIQQRVVVNDSYANNHIKVTASPSSFTVTYPSTYSVDLTLNIDHTGTSIVYDPLDVVAKYLITTEPNFNLALAANPINGPNWSLLNIPQTNNTNAAKTVYFENIPQGTYYIHWYVESGEVYAHSLDVTDPPALYGGFGPYRDVLEICDGKGVSFTTVPTDGGTPSYQWFKNGTAIPGATASTYYYVPADGDEIYCRMISTVACASPATVYSQAIPIKATPSPVVSLAALPSEVCSGGSTTLTATVTGSTTTAMTYTWYRGATQLGVTTTNTYNLSSLTLTEDYSVAVLNENGCTGSATVTITVYDLPVVNISANPTAVCYGEASTLTATVTGGTTPSMTYTWYREAAQLGTTTVNSYNVSTAGTYLVTVFNSNGCTATSSPVTITVVPTVDLSSTYSDVSVVAGTVIGPFNAAGTLTGASWTNSNTAVGLGASGTMPIGAFTATNSTSAPISSTVTVTPYYVLNGETCIGTPATFIITVMPASGIVILPEAPAPICVGGTVNLAPSTPTLNLGVCTLIGTSGTWTLDGTDFIPPLTLNADGTYVLGYRINTSCGIFSSNTVTVTVNALPVVNIAANSPTVCNGGSSTLTATVTGGTTTATTYTWYSGATQLGTTTVNDYNLSPVTATAAYSVTVINSNGCTATSSPVTITVHDVPSVGDLTVPSALCSGDQLDVPVPTVQDNGTVITDEFWTFGGSIITMPYTVAYSEDGNILYYSAVNACGTTPSATVA
ncbi:MAG: hypothetical protein LBH91_05270, partial [Prevotellaceae bacterium]|nr:hypothetical protein [Prevotellaceae bacterium]